MATIVKNKIFTDFLKGELSPRVELRDDLEGRQHGVETLINWSQTLQGTVFTSHGTEWIKDFAESYARVFEFIVSYFTVFSVVVTANKVYVTDENGVLESSDLLTNYDFNDGSTGWTSSTLGGASVSFSTGAVTLTGGVPASNVALIRQSGTCIAGNNHSVIINVLSIGNSGDQLEVYIGNTVGASDLYDGVITSLGSTVIPDIIPAGTTIWVEVRVAGESQSFTLSAIHCHDETVGSPDIEFVSPWTDKNAIDSIQIEMSPKGPELYMVSGTVAPQVLTYNTTTRAWTFAPVSFTSPPAAWTGTNWPGAICIHQGRLLLGGTAADPTSFIASVSDNYTDLTLGSLATDAYSYRINRNGRIRWMKGGITLVIGTDNSEHIVFAEGGVLIPGDVDSKIQSTNGSAPIQAIEVGNQIVYVSSDRRKVRAMEYEWSRDAWRSRDLTFASEHLTSDGNLIKDILWSPNPFSRIVCLTDKGTLLEMTYDPSISDGGWARREMGGIIQGFCNIPIAGSDDIWLIIDRSDDGTLISEEKITVTEHRKVDSHKHFSFETPDTDIVVPHLAGKTCEVLIDGAVHPKVIPDAVTGEVTTDWAGNEITIGLGFTSTLITMPLSDSVNPLGTTRTMKKRWVKTFVKILSSFRPKINGIRPADRGIDTLMDTAESPKTEVLQVGLRGVDDYGRITIEQDLPLVTEIGGIFGQVEQSEI